MVGATVLGATVLREPIASAAPAILQVFVTNDAANPVPVHEQGTVAVSDPEVGHQPWHVFLHATDEYTVPAGKRLVIEYANAVGVAPAPFGQPDWTLDVQEPGGGGQGYHFLGLSLPGCTDCYVVSQTLRLYAPAGSVVSVGVMPLGSLLRLSGYLIDV